MCPPSSVTHNQTNLSAAWTHSSPHFLSSVCAQCVCVCFLMLSGCFFIFCFITFRMAAAQSVADPSNYSTCFRSGSLTLLLRFYCQTRLSPKEKKLPRQRKNIWRCSSLWLCWRGAKPSEGTPQHELIITDIHILVGNYIFQGQNLLKPVLGYKCNVTVSPWDRQYADHGSIVLWECLCVCEYVCVSLSGKPI